MAAEARIRAYYEALSSGEPLPPFFAREPWVVKYGIGERLAGYEEIAAGLREQTETTEDWVVESERLSVTERGAVAWFSDDVRMAWTDVETGDRHEHETRWSGTLERRERDGSERWFFVGMHVSVPGDP